MSELVSDTPSSPDSWFTICLNCVARHLFGARQVPDQSRIEIARARAHHQSGRRREAHARVDALAIAHGREARAVAEVGEDDAAVRGRRDRQAASSSIRYAYDKPWKP